MISTMSTSYLNSPSASYPHQEHELSSLDFLALTGLDSSISDTNSPQANLSQSNHRQHDQGGDAEGQTSNGRQSSIFCGEQRRSSKGLLNSMEVDEHTGSALPGLEHGNDGENQLQDFDSLQAALLQQQLQAIHMQSPLGFDTRNPTYPLGQLLASPAFDELHSQPNEHPEQQNFSVHNTHPSSRSVYDSPTSHLAFNAHGHRSSFSSMSTRSPIEQLQRQQQQFQEQLVLLQRQQLEMQATAAAVMAASVSPCIGLNGPSSTGPRPSVTPGMTPSSSNTGMFSPLTSPALEATSYPHQSHVSLHSQQFSPAYGSQQIGTSHILNTALSSPALNPIGSTGGANQTLSPALNPQNEVNTVDSDYLRAFMGMLDGTNSGNSTPGGELPQPSYQSPSMTSTSTAGNSTIISSPALYPQGVGTGPHRQSLPFKSRPSPMLKPTHHRSHHRNSGSGNVSIPPSPAVQKYHPDASMPPAAMNAGLPPPAIEHRQIQSNLSVSSTSTPSPVDLSHIMPPPPVPTGKPKARKGVLPMTPASLMNLGSAEKHGSLSVPPPVPPKPQTSSESNSSIDTVTAATSFGSTSKSVAGKKKSGSQVGKKTAGSKLVPVGTTKRTLAMRPQTIVGVRAATKAAAAAASIATAEPENRKISHKAAEQKRRDSLKAGFDELRLLLPPINTEALDPLSGEPIPGSSAPRLLPKSSLVPDDNPNRGVSKVALLRFGNEYIGKLQERVDRRDLYIDKLREEVKRLREGAEGGGVMLDNGEDLLEHDWREGEEDEFGEDDGDGDNEDEREGGNGDEG
ncbi:hypothetical protein C366_00922 [Cryptococcus neoformans Tu401-1]|nr:hypothetical protein C366_00922 [Cryptococcus neoformans var. grubii Tu401-1]OXM81372.1 hypothetical protein C364_00925 [Cryptococcus neoformans var. grubii Bt63]